MADLDDGPDQTPLDKFEVQQTILSLLPHHHFDLVISHSPAGEYTRHIRHEEVGRAVIDLWQYGSLSTDELWLFAYEDGGKRYLPRPIESAPGYYVLPGDVWQKKYEIITQIYGFAAASFEAQTTPRCGVVLAISHCRRCPAVAGSQRMAGMRVLVLYEYPPPPAGLATQGDLLYQGLLEIGVDAHAVNFASDEEKEWYYRWFKPDIAVGIGYWGYTPHLVLHPQRHGIQPVPWLVADGYVANYHQVLNALPLILVTSNWVKEVYVRDGIRADNIEVLARRL